MDSLERRIGLITSSDILNHEQDNDGEGKSRMTFTTM
jgi:hypothetical protein